MRPTPGSAGACRCLFGEGELVGRAEHVLDALVEPRIVGIATDVVFTQQPDFELVVGRGIGVLTISRSSIIRPDIGLVAQGPETAAVHGLVIDKNDKGVCRSPAGSPVRNGRTPPVPERWCDGDSHTA